MVSLTLMARLLEAVRPDARLVLVGDPDQLTSVEAGAVLADLVTGLGERDSDAVAALVTDHRSKSATITQLAAAIQRGDPDAVLKVLAAGDDTVELIDPDTALSVLQDELTQDALEVRAQALAGDAAGALASAERHRLLCAHREGPWGIAHWNRQVERWLGDASGTYLGVGTGSEWYPGRPVLITANDYGLGLFNGDTGITVAEGENLRVHFSDGPSLAISRLGDIETLYAMTVHKSQGSQADTVTVLLPEVDSPLLTRGAVLHRGHARPATRARRRHSGRRACSGPTTSATGDRAGSTTPGPLTLVAGGECYAPAHLDGAKPAVRHRDPVSVRSARLLRLMVLVNAVGLHMVVEHPQGARQA